MLITVIVFAVFLYIFGYAALYRRKTVGFEEYKTYIVRFTPKNFFGLINYLLKHAGHVAIYQDGRLYKYDNGELIEKPISFNYIHKFNGKKLFLEERKRSITVHSQLGVRYKLLTNNCNSLCDIK